MRKKIPRKPIILGMVGIALLIAWPILRATRSFWLDIFGYRIATFDFVSSWIFPIAAVLCIVVAIRSFFNYVHRHQASQEAAEQAAAARSTADLRAASEAMAPSARLEIFRTELSKRLGQRGSLKLPEPVRILLQQVSDKADYLDELYDGLKRLIRASGGEIRTGVVAAQTVVSAETFETALDEFTKWFSVDLRATLETVIATGVIPGSMEGFLQRVSKDIEQLTAMWEKLPDVEITARLDGATKVGKAMNMFAAVSGIETNKKEGD